MYDLKSWEPITELTTLQPATAMKMLGTSKNDRGVLVYGLGDEGYGLVHLDEDFRIYETQTGSEKYRKAVAKTNIIGMSAREGFLWKLGGYTAITGGYTRKS